MPTALVEMTEHDFTLDAVHGMCAAQGFYGECEDDGFGACGECGQSVEGSPQVRSRSTIRRSTVILRNREHVYVRHTACKQIHCHICEGGLSLCENCHGTEASLTTHCAGHPLGELFHSLIANDGLDYVDGRWVFIETAYTFPAQKRAPVSTEAFIAGLIASAEERLAHRRAQMDPAYFASKGDRLAIAVRPASAGA
jgi:hypothetical protein